MTSAAKISARGSPSTLLGASLYDSRSYPNTKIVEELKKVSEEL